MSEELSYLFQPPITLVCPPKLKTRLMLRLADWATDLHGQLDPGIQVHTGRRDRDDYGTAPGQTYFTIVPGVFVLYGDPPFTGDGGQPIAWWRAPHAYFLSEDDLEPATNPRLRSRHERGYTHRYVVCHRATACKRGRPLARRTHLRRLPARLQRPLPGGEP
jgi:hypothetical protein